MRIGIIGCGLIGHKRAAAAKQGGHDIIAVADKSSAAAQTLAEKTGAKISADWQTLLRESLDMVVIATSHDSLAEIALAAVQAGKHVLVEKPAGRNAAEIRAVAEAAKANNVLVKVGFNHRFHPAFQKAHALFTDGVIGELMYIRGRYGHGGRRGMESEWRCQKEISGGGELIDQGSHLIDLSRWFLGDVSLDYAAVPTYFWDIQVDDNCFMALKSSKGQLAWLHATWTEWKNTFSFEICGRDGKLQIDGLGGSYGTERLSHYHMLPEMGPPETTIYEFPGADTSWQAECDEFIAAIQAQRAPVGNINDALAMLTIIDTIYAQNNSMRNAA